MPAEVINILIRSMLSILVISIILGLYYWKRLPVAFKFLSFFLWCNLLVEVIVFFLPKGMNNLPLLHLYTLLGFILISLIYQKMGLLGNWPNKYFVLFLASISGLLVLNSIFLESIYTYNSYAKTLVQLFLIGYAVSYMFQLKESSPDTGALNLMNYAILIAYSGSLFIFMFGNVLLADEFDNLFWEINIILNLLFQILILISIWKACRARKLQF